MIKYLKKLAIWILTYMTCYLVLSSIIPVGKLQFSIHGWAWLLFFVVEFGVATALSFLDPRKRPSKINPAVQRVVAEIFVWMGFAVSLVVTAAVLPHLASYNSAPLAFALTGVLGFSSGISSEVLRRLGLDKKPDAK